MWRRAPGTTVVTYADPVVGLDGPRPGVIAAPGRRQVAPNQWSASASKVGGGGPGRRFIQAGRLL
jgi:hypothetical protein